MLSLNRRNERKRGKMTPIKYTDRKRPAALLHIYAKHVMKTQSYCWFIHGNRINLYFKWTNSNTHRHTCTHIDHNQLTQCVEICRYLMLHLMNNVSVVMHMNVCQSSETFKMMTTKRILSKQCTYAYEEILVIEWQQRRWSPI